METLGRLSRSFAVLVGVTISPKETHDVQTLIHSEHG